MKFDWNFSNERSDERVAKEAIIAYWQANLNPPIDIRYEQEIQSKNPDYEFIFENGSKLIEIRQTGTGFILNNQEPLERCEQERSIVSLIASLKVQIRSWAKPGQAIILIADQLIRSLGRKSIRKLNDQLKLKFENELETGKPEKIEVEDDIFWVRSTMYYKDHPENYSPLFFVYGPSLNHDLQSLENNLLLQAVYIIQLCITEKEKKYKQVSLGKWLVIINVHPILKLQDYRDAFDRLRLNNTMPSHSFEKIFIIDDGKAYLLA